MDSATVPLSVTKRLSGDSGQSLVDSGTESCSVATFGVLYQGHQSMGFRGIRPQHFAKGAHPSIGPQ